MEENGGKMGGMGGKMGRNDREWGFWDEKREQEGRGEEKDGKEKE